MYNLELNKREVRAIGERRWLRGHWKKATIYIGGSLLGILILATILSVYLDSLPLRMAISIPLLVLWGTSYIIFMIKMDKAGKEYLRTIQK